jgi:iduronate 2-sulfatase
VADHGYHIGEHTLWGKTSNFEYDARVPFFIATPGNKNAGHRTQSLAELLDLFPTLVDLCELPTPDGLEGTSLAPVLRDPTKSVKSAAFTQHPRPAYYDREPGKQPTAMGVSVRTATVRYTEWRDWKTGGIIGRELYDNKQEPAELESLVDDTRFGKEQNEAENLLRKQFPVGRALTAQAVAVESWADESE